MRWHHIRNILNIDDLLVGLLVGVFLLPSLGNALIKTAFDFAEIDRLYRTVSYVAFGFLSVSALFIGYKEIVLHMKRDLMIIAFFLVVISSGVYGWIQGESVVDICRGICPFLWAAFIPVFRSRNGSGTGRRLLSVIKFFSIAYSLWLLMLVVFCFATGAHYRITGLWGKSTSFITVAGSIVFFVEYVNTGKWLNYAFSLFCTVAFVCTESKSMLVAFCVGAIYYGGMFILKREYTSVYLKRILAISIGSFVVIFMLLSYTSMGNRYFEGRDVFIAKLSESTKREVVDGSVTPRLIEKKTAYNAWRENIVFGKGIGYRWKAEGINYDNGKGVLYMHNIVAYTMMDFGLVGLCFLMMLVMRFYASQKDLLRFYPKPNVHDVSGPVLCAAAIYSCFTAVFRNIEFVVIISFVISMLDVTNEIE